MQGITSSFFKIGEGVFNACGNNLYGQLGLGTQTSYEVLPKEIPIAEVDDIVAGLEHTFFLMKDKTVRCVGNNQYGQLGLGNVNDVKPVIQNPGLTNVKSVAAHAYGTIVLFEDGTVKGCGLNNVGEIGDGTVIFRNGFAPLLPVGVKDVAVGVNHTLFLTTTNDLKTCGSNANGQLGTNNTSNRSTPDVVLSDVKEIFTGTLTSFAIMNDGTVKGCGYNTYSQLGLGAGNNTDKKVFTTMPITGVKKIIANTFHTIFLMNDGTVKGCGMNTNYQLGLDVLQAYTDITTLPITDVVDVICGLDYTIFLKNDVTYVSTGTNDKAQLGNNATAVKTKLATGYIADVIGLPGDVAKYGGIIKKFLLKAFNKLFKINSTNLLNIDAEINLDTLKTHGTSISVKYLNQVTSITINTIIHDVNIYKTFIDKSKVQNLSITLNTTNSKSLIKIGSDFYNTSGGLLTQVVLEGANIAVNDLVNNGMDSVSQGDLVLLPSEFEIYTYTLSAFSTVTLSFDSRNAINCFNNIEILEYSNNTVTNNGVMKYAPYPSIVEPSNSIDLSFVEDILSIDLSFNISGGGVIKLAASADDGITWYTYSIESGWYSINLETILTNGMTPEMLTFLDMQWNTLPDILNTRSLRFAYGLSTNSITDIAETTQLSITYNARGIYELQTLSECEISYPDSDIITISFIDTGIYKVNIPQ